MDEQESRGARVLIATHHVVTAYSLNTCRSSLKTNVYHIVLRNLRLNRHLLLSVIDFVFDFVCTYIEEGCMVYSKVTMDSSMHFFLSVVLCTFTCNGKYCRDRSGLALIITFRNALYTRLELD